MEAYDVHEQFRFTERVSRRTGGKFKIQPALTGELGIARDETPEALSQGKIDMLCIQSGHGEAILPHLGVFHLPYLAYSLDDWRKIAEATQSMTFSKMQALGFQPASTRSFYQSPPQDMTTIEPLDNLLDLDGRKIRVSRKLDTDLVNAMGGEAIYMAFTEVYMAMQRGVIEGLITGAQAMWAISIYEVSNHVYTISLPPVAIWNVVNTERYNALPDAYKEILEEETNDMNDEIAYQLPRFLSQSLADLGSKGMTQTDPNEAEIEAWMAKAIPLWETWADTPDRKEALAIAKQVMGIK